MRRLLDTWGLGLERIAIATFIARASISTFAKTSTTAFPRLRALLGIIPVFGLVDGAVLVIGVDGAVFGPVVLPK